MKMKTPKIEMKHKNFFLIFTCLILNLKKPFYVHLNKNINYKSYKKNKQNLEILTI
jgi:hypothetical protein